MKANRPSRSIIGSFCLLLAICLPAFATTLFDTGNTSLNLGDQVQMGRLVRSSFPSEWDLSTPFPGENNTGVAYHFRTITLPASMFVTTPFVQITVNDPNAAIFSSVYLDSYDPTVGNKGTNYFGDEGFTGNFPNDTGFYQLQVPPGHDVVLLVNDTIPGNGGLSSPYRVLVEGFTNTQYASPSTPTPTPTPKPTPPVISVAVSPASVKEGKDAVFTFTANPASHASVTINYTMSGQATNGSDYTLSGTPGKVTIGVSKATATVTLHSIVDNLDEGSESAILTVQPGTGYTVGSPKTVTVLIKDKN
jgi:hypothetical protein